MNVMGGDGRLALVTGSTRGIGHEVARQLDALGYTVIVTGRESPAVRAAASGIGPRVVPMVLDVTDQDSIRTIAVAIRDRFGVLDVLVNNAAILLDEGTSILKTSPADFDATYRANALGPLLMTQAVSDLLQRSNAPRVVNVSSGAGQISSMTTYAPAYSISKAALNAITVMLAAALPKAKVNCVDPGWVRTDMGGMSAPRDVEKGAETIVWLATLPASGPTGGFFHDRKRIPW
jgi:NAD(P)-dependent dehydrogenase (short-subunit alcohol dehydrogenase family)